MDSGADQLNQILLIKSPISFESVASALNSGLFMFSIFYVTLKKNFKNFIPTIKMETNLFLVNAKEFREVAKGCRIK